MTQYQQNKPHISWWRQGEFWWFTCYIVLQIEYWKGHKQLKFDAVGCDMNYFCYVNNEHQNSYFRW